MTDPIRVPIKFGLVAELYLRERPKAASPPTDDDDLPVGLQEQLDIAADNSMPPW